MIFQLTPQIYWGNWQSIGECPQPPGSILNVSQNQRRRYYALLRNIDQTIPYFRLGRHDDSAVDGRYLGRLASVADTIVSQQLFPVLVHCVAGGHRSPAAAIYLAWRMAGQRLADLEMLKVHAKTIRGKIETTRAYHQSLMAYCESASQ